MLGGKLRIDPFLPDEWTKLTYNLIWHGQNLNVCVTHQSVTVKNLTETKTVELELCGRTMQLEQELLVDIR